MMDNQAVCSGIIAALPAETSQFTLNVEPRQVYLPSGHHKVLGKESSLITGGRGVGKSFWFAVLQNENIRGLLSRHAPQLADLAKFDVAAGFGQKSVTAHYPDPDTFKQLLQQAEPYHIWRAVAARWIARVLKKNDIPVVSWNETVLWATQRSEDFAGLMEEGDEHFRRQEKYGLILFDALDRSSDNWEQMDRIVRDLLRFVLSIKSFSNLCAKVFLRDDQFENRIVTDFPDASKIKSTRVQLAWGRLDLYGLLWQHLINGKGQFGASMRSLTPSFEKLDWRAENSIYQTPPSLRIEENLQKEAFNELSGQWMGKDRRKGHTYTWLVNHLADGNGRVSPRSFLAAVRIAAEDSLAQHPNHEYPLHYNSIHEGVLAASAIRVEELKEDYPWVERLMKPLEKLSVPCMFQDVDARWREKKVFGGISSADRLPPEHLNEESEGVRQDLEQLGIFTRMHDDRVNVPDLFRVGYNMGRRGGIKPAVRNG